MFVMCFRCVSVFCGDIELMFLPQLKSLAGFAGLKGAQPGNSPLVGGERVGGNPGLLVRGWGQDMGNPIAMQLQIRMNVEDA